MAIPYDVQCHLIRRIHELGIDGFKERVMTMPELSSTERAIAMNFMVGYIHSLIDGKPILR